jgi:hypothetical protein
LGSFPAESGSALGNSLVRYHGLMAGIEKSAYAVMFSRSAPWILSVHQQAVQAFSALSAGNAQMLAIVRKYPDFQRHLDELRKQWTVDDFVHGDMKWDNCLIQSSGKDGLFVRIVDWELADFGDGAWDVGAILQAFVSHWVLSIPCSNELPARMEVDFARCPLEKMQPAIRAFWSAYQAGEKRARNWPAFLRRAIQYAAARMIQTVYEHMHQSPHLTPSALGLLQVSLNMLHRPEDAQRHLLGL